MKTPNTNKPMNQERLQLIAGVAMVVVGAILVSVIQTAFFGALQGIW